MTDTASRRASDTAFLAITSLALRVLYTMESKFSAASSDAKRRMVIS